MKNLCVLLVTALSMAALAACLIFVKPTPTVSALTYTYEYPKIRLVVMKHCREQMADDDADLAIKGAERAAAKGLPIKTIGNQLIDRNGKARVAMYDFDWDDLPRVRAFASEQLKIDAESGDTVIIFTIGHGGQGGDLMTLGQREGVMKAFASAAEDNDQKVLWWQLSCHASMRLPSVSTLPEKQQELLSIVASSGTELSPAGIEGKIMERVFMAMAEQSKDIDPNEDGVITKTELSGFFRKIGNPRAERVFAKSGDSSIFGGGGNLANQIPIIDRNNPQSKYKNYIPMPQGR